MSIVSPVTRRRPPARSTRPGKADDAFVAPLGLLRRVEGFIVPSANPALDDAHDDYRPLVASIALVAVGFFLPSFLIAGVPADRWPTFALVGVVAGIVIAGTFFISAPRQSLAMYFAAGNALLVAVIGQAFGAYYHEITLLFALLVAAHAIIHGLRAALVAVALGSVLVPTVIQGSAGPFNWTDPVYAAIYLFGMAAVPWTARRLARNRLEVVRLQVVAAVGAEREAVLVLARAAEAKDEVTGDHVARVGDLSAALAERIGLDAELVQGLRYAAMLHDVGKLHVPDAILMKPGELTRDEWAVVREHAIWGERILGTTNGFAVARRIARSHHENWDGSGYPDGLMGEGIPLVARVVHIADVFDALYHRRPYKPAWPIERCIDELVAGRGTRYDPDLVGHFVDLLQGQPLLWTSARTTIADFESERQRRSMRAAGLDSARSHAR